MRQGRTDAWIAHQLEVSVSDIRAFKREHDLVPDDAGADGDEAFAGSGSEELDLRAEDDALVAAALEAEQEEDEEEEEEEEDAEEDEDKPRRRRRKPKELEGTFDHGDEGYGLWLDPAVQDDPVYAEHWAGHRPVTVTVEPEQIVIRRAGEEAGDDDSDD